MPKVRWKSDPRLPERAEREDAGSRKLRPVNNRHLLLICLVLAVLTVAAFSQVFKCGLTNYDDDDYVTANHHIQSITWHNIIWTFNVGYAANWHPLTWMSHMVDYRLFGANPIGHHLVNLLIHLANTLLLFLILTRMTARLSSRQAGSLWRSAFVAALFAVHPLHVESVAWIAERKDVLSTLFFMLTILAYLRYVDKPGIARYSLVIGLFALGLMAKPMLVTLPFVLLLFDYWPLGRARKAWSLLWEKMPLIIVAGGSSILTYLAQKKGGAVSAFETEQLGVRVSNAVVSYASYILKMLWPQHLAAAYPLPGDGQSPLAVIGALLLLAAMTFMAIRFRRDRSYLLFGWLWFLGTLVPVIGLVQVGSQAMADRYTYIPLIGLFIAVVWSIPNAILETKRWGDGGMGRWGAAGMAVAGMVIVALAAMTWVQVGYWRDSVILMKHAIAVTRDNFIAHNSLGSAYAELGKTDDAIREYREAIRINPNYTMAQSNLAAQLQKQGRLDEAAEIGMQAANMNPQSAEIHYNNGLLLHQKGDLDGAVREYEEALRIQPDFPDAHKNLALVYYFKGDYADAWKEVYLCLSQGGTPHPDFLQALAEKMPDPGR